MVNHRNVGAPGLRVLLLVLVLLAAVPASQAAPVPQGQDEFEVAPFSAAALRAPIVVDGGARPGVARHPRLDAGLAALAQAANNQAAGAETSADGPVHVQIHVDPAEQEQVRAAVAAAGGELTGAGLGGTLAQAWLPAGALTAIAATPGVRMVSQPDRAYPLGEPQVGGATTEGVGAINAPAWHAAGYRGQGITIGVIDTGFAGYSSLAGSDLPSGVTMRSFVDGDAGPSTNDPHGTACAEIIYDIAPQSQIILARVSTLVDTDEAVTWLISQGVDIISSSIGFYNVAPGDGTGPLATIVNRASSAGILWVTAASNDREAHWGGGFSDTDGDGYLNFATGSNVNYFVNNANQAITIPAGYPISVFARWSDWARANQDYDLYLVRFTGSQWVIVGGSENFQQGLPGQRPVEAARITAASASVYGFAIRRASSLATEPVNFEIFAPKVARLSQFVPARSLGNLADVPSALTVAALDVQPPFPQEYYSSEGPTNGPGGSATGGIMKPDIAAFANVATRSYGTGAGRFNGTSSATPHVAGAAAVLLSATPTLSVGDLGLALRSRAIDIGASGADTQFGFGRLTLGSPGSASFRKLYLPMTGR